MMMMCLLQTRCNARKRKGTATWSLDGRFIGVIQCNRCRSTVASRQFSELNLVLSDTNCLEGGTMLYETEIADRENGYFLATILISRCTQKSN